MVLTKAVPSSSVASIVPGPAADGRPGLAFERHHTREGADPFDTVEWERRDAVITNASGKVVFEQRGVEFPKSWSQMATNVVVQKYFRGTLGTDKRENSVRSMIGRVADTIYGWGRAAGYFRSDRDALTFRDELVYLLLHQKMAFNSPVWFNVGVEAHPQCSACFINSVEDSMDSILGLAKTEGMLFKYGSGTGSNLSTIRGSRENLRGGGTASGPVTFMRGFDSFAGAVKSGGKTRRAAKMVILNVDHPDVVDFIECKAREEKKAHALVDAGFDGSFDVPGGAYDSVGYQNANHSIRVTEDFMTAVQRDGEWSTKAVTDGRKMDTYRAKDMMKKIAEAAWTCGDPGLQYDTTINDWHTCIDTARINASNPCFTGDSLVHTDRGLIAFRDLLTRVKDGEEFRVYTHRMTAKQPGEGVMLSKPTQIMVTGINDVFRLRFSNGMEVRCTEKHRFFTKNRGYVEACDLKADDEVATNDVPTLPECASTQLPVSADWNDYRGSGDRDRPMNFPQQWSVEFAELLGHFTGDGSFGETMLCWVYGSDDDRAVLMPKHRTLLEEIVGHVNHAVQANGTEQLRTTRRPFARFLEALGVKRATAKDKRVPNAIFEAPPAIVAAYLRGLFDADGCAYDGASSTRYIGLASKSEGLLQDVQRLLSMFGVYSTIYVCEQKSGGGFNYTSKDGTVVNYKSEGPHLDLRLSNKSIAQFAEFVGFNLPHKQEKLRGMLAEHGFYNLDRSASVVSMECEGPEVTYNLTEPLHHSYIVNGLIVRNCSEYMFLDDSACNLASLNLRRFQDEAGDLEVVAFRHAIQTSITAMEIIVGNSSYPTPKIAENSHAYRPLGLGYANLGAMLMSRSMAYDSDAGRAYAAAVTALMCGEAYLQSARISADATGPFAGYDRNEAPFVRVMRKHRAAVDQVDARHVPSDLIAAARLAWDRAIELGQRYGFRNGQATVLAPTGTIGFLMDCDTTGVEPDIALVKYKRLVGGGMLKIVNGTVPEALRRLGYSAAEVEAIVAHVDAKDTIEGAPHLKAEDLPVFDCAFRPATGERSIHYMGHIRMMGAVQPFLSGAISKTVNMPADCTAADIEDAYIQAWKLGLKAIAVFRDGCKRTQPLSTSLAQASSSGQKVDSSVDPLTLLADDERCMIEALRARKNRPAGPPSATRYKLPNERASITHKFSIGGHEGYVTVGMYEDGSLGEIFVRMAKEGSAIAGLMDSFATAISLALQHGVPIHSLIEKFKGTRFEPSGFTGNQEIPLATSIMDYLFRWLAIRFPADGTVAQRHPAAAQLDLPKVPLLVGDGSKSATSPIAVVDATATAAVTKAPAQPRDRTWVSESNAPPCHECGTLMIRGGACHKCPNCGATSGCS
jgi:ribonucleoside-diphosphate reductase alpha chain